jgi:Fe-S cluster assembly ATP-binding protein
VAGRQSYQVTDGQVLYNGKDLLAMAPEERAGEGVFMAFQYPVEVPGVGNMHFLRASINAVRKYRGEPEVDIKEFLSQTRAKMKELHFDEKMLRRGLNEGFSGGEKKRNEILQMAVLEPTLAVLDETDSGLDIDALKDVAEGVNSLRSPDRAIVLVTHYQRILNYIVPDKVHILYKGRIVKSGGKELAHELEAKGYAELVGDDEDEIEAAQA